MPLTLRRGSHTAAWSAPMRQVPTGCRFEMPLRADRRLELGVAVDPGAGQDLLGDVWRHAPAAG